MIEGHASNALEPRMREARDPGAGKVSVEGMALRGMSHETAIAPAESQKPAGADLSQSNDQNPDRRWSETQGEYRVRLEVPQAKEQGMPQTTLQDTAVSRTDGMVAPGQMTRSVSSEAGPSVSVVPAPAQSPVLAHEMSPPIPGASRSVVLEVAQPDLGHVNVRVAVANDLVHAYLFPDRVDVGQYLLNGQDRLQTALQAAGLDMGQFKVQVERQGAQQQGSQDWSSSRGYEQGSQTGQRDHRGQERDAEAGGYSLRRRSLGGLSVFA